MKKIGIVTVLIGAVLAIGVARAGDAVSSFAVPELVDEINTAFAGNAGAVVSNGGTVTATENGAGAFHQTVLTLASTPIIIVGASGVGFGGVQLYDFPAGHIWVQGVIVDALTTVLGAGVTVGGGGDYGIGTAVVGDADLGDATDVDLLASTSVDPLVTATDAALAAAAGFDGSSTAKNMFLNGLVDDADIAGTCTNLVSGTITVTWVDLGDD